MWRVVVNKPIYYLSILYNLLVLLPQFPLSILLIQDSIILALSDFNRIIKK